MRTSESEGSVAWELVGMRSATTARLGGPVRTEPWKVPLPLTLKRGRLYPPPTPSRLQRAEVPSDLLDRVTRLASASDRDVAGFARRHGLLLVCEQHELPVGHGLLIGFEDEEKWCAAPGGRRPFVSTEVYRRLGRWVRAVLNLGAALHQAEGREHSSMTDGWSVPLLPSDMKGRAEDWLLVYPALVEMGGVKVGDEREVLGIVLDRWLELTDVRLTFAWDDLVRLDVDVRNLWQAVIANLVFAVAKTEGLAVCVACGRVYAPSRRPAPGHRNYCTDPECQKARWRDAKRDQRARDANKKKES